MIMAAMIGDGQVRVLRWAFDPTGRVDRSWHFAHAGFFAKKIRDVVPTSA